MHIAIYSGSFNPVHNGHTRLAEYLIKKNLADEVWFVVSPCNPLKNQIDLIDEYVRLEMLILAIGNNPSFKVSDIEFTMPIPSYSIVITSYSIHYTKLYEAVFTFCSGTSSTA